MVHAKKLAACTILVAMVVGITGCATVEPWERGKLAKPKMALEPDALASSIETHVYNYREGSTGGFGSVGGGCGCN